MAEKRYFALTEGSSTFVDPRSGMKIVNDQVIAIRSKNVRFSSRVKDALKGGHIKEVKEGDYTEYQKKATKQLDKAEEVGVRNRLARNQRTRVRENVEADVKEKSPKSSKEERKAAKKLEGEGKGVGKTSPKTEKGSSPVV